MNNNQSTVMETVKTVSEMAVTVILTGLMCWALHDSNKFMLTTSVICLIATSLRFGGNK